MKSFIGMVLRKRNTIDRSPEKEPKVNSPSMTLRPLLDLNEAADYLRVSRTTFYLLRQSAAFPTPVRLNGKTLFFVDDLLEYARRHKVEK